MGDHKEVFRSLLELFPQVDHRILKAIAIEHHKDVDSAVVAVLDEVMPSMTNSDGSLSANHEVVPSFVPSFPGSVGNAFANYSTHEVGSSSSAGHDILGKEGNGSVHSAHDTSSVEVTTGTQENIDSELHEGRLTSIHVMSEQLKTQHSDPIPNGDQHDLIPNLDAVSSNTRPERKLANSDTEVRCGILSACFSQLPAGANCGDSCSEAPQLHDQDSSNSPVGDCFAQNNSLKLFSGYEDINFDDDLFFSDLLAFSSKDQVSSGILISGKDSFSPVLDIPSPDTEGSFTGTSGVIEQKNTSNSGTDNKQLSGDILENDEIPLSSKMDMLPDLNLDHFASTASTHSSHSVSIECLEDSIADARSNKNDLLPSLELVTKMIEDVELLEEKAKVAKHESSVAGTGILTKVEELKEMLTHAMEANDMHASEVFGEKAILTTEARELQSRLQRLSDERNKNLVIIEEIRQTLDERLVAAQQEIAEAEKEKNEKEAAAQALLDEQEKMMNSIVEESRRLQKEAEENLKLKEFLVERGQIVDVLQGEIAVICEDVSLLKRVVDERLSLSRLQRSTMSSLSSSLHSSLHKSCSSSDRTTEAIESPDKHTVPEAGSPVGRDLGDIPSTEEVSDVNDTIDKDICKRVDSNEDADGWELLEE